MRGFAYRLSAVSPIAFQNQEFAINTISRNRKCLGWLGLVAVGLGAPAPLYAGTGSVAPITVTNVSYDGLSRSYLKYIPPGLSAGPAPLVFVFHGGTLTAEDVTSNPNSADQHWMALADAENFIVVYPNGVDKQWHDCRSDGHDDIGTADDVGFVSALIEHVDASHDIDLTRVYATGASNGGMMTYRVGMELTHRFAGIAAGISSLPVDAPYLSSLPVVATGECRDADRPINVVITNGDADEPAWGGGQTGAQGGATEHGEVRSTLATRDYWIDINGTGTELDQLYIYPDVNTSDGSPGVSRQRHWGAFITDPQVTLFQVLNGGHSLASTHHFASSVYRALYGKQNWDMESSTEIWARLKNFSRAGAATALPVTLLNEGFEGGISTWSPSGSVVSSNTSPHAGIYSARLVGVSSITKFVSTVGRAQVRLRFALKTGSLAQNLDEGEYLKAEWSNDGNTWALIKRTQVSSWEKETFTLPPQAAGQANFRIKFSTNTNHNKEYGYVDSVELIGQ